MPVRAYRRWLSALVVIVLLLPSTALAQSGFSWCSVDGPFVTGGSTYDKGYVVLNCSNANLAALAVIGRSGDYLQLTSEQLAKLSNESTGGAFYTLTSRFRAVGASGSQSPYYPSWWGSGSLGNVQSGFQIDNAYAALMVDVSGGYGTVWAVETNASQIASALEDYEVIYNGGDLGGGGTTGPTQLPTFFSTDTSVMYKLGRFEPVTTPIEITLSGDFLSRAGNLLANHGPYWAYAFTQRSYNPRDGASSFSLYISTEPFELYLINGTQRLKSNGVIYYLDSASVSKTSGKITLNGSSVFSSGTFTINNGQFAYTRAFATDNQYIGWSNLGQSDTPVTPPNNWPDPPSDPTPTPPTVPDPPTNTPVTEPEPPTSPTTPVYTVTNVYEGDTYVTADIAAVLDALDEHCIHLQDAIRYGLSNYYSSMTSYLDSFYDGITDYMGRLAGWIIDTIEDEFSYLCDYMRDVAEWLADQLEYSFGGTVYNDSSVLSWLRRIYLQLGRGGGTTRPTDPVSDPFGIGKWLTDLFSNLVDSLTDLGLNGLAGVVDALRTLITKFPFSIPWDIGALLALLAATPEAPQFDLPLIVLTGNGIQQIGTQRYSLDWLSGAMDAVRWINKLAFCFLLASKTKDMMEIISMSRGGGSNG